MKVESLIETAVVKRLRLCSKITMFEDKGGGQSLVLYVNQLVTWPPVAGLTPDFAYREQMGFTFQRKIFVS